MRQRLGCCIFYCSVKQMRLVFSEKSAIAKCDTSSASNFHVVLIIITHFNDNTTSIPSRRILTGLVLDQYLISHFELREWSRMFVKFFKRLGIASL